MVDMKRLERAIDLANEEDYQKLMDLYEKMENAFGSSKEVFIGLIMKKAGEIIEREDKGQEEEVTTVEEDLSVEERKKKLLDMYKK